MSQVVENSLTSKCPTRLGSFSTCFFLGQNQSGGLDHLRISNTPLCYFLSSLLCDPVLGSQPLGALMLSIPVEMSALEEEATQATHPNMTIRPLSPSSAVLASLTSIPGQKRLCLLGKGFKPSCMGRQRKNVGTEASDGDR